MAPSDKKKKQSATFPPSPSPKCEFCLKPKTSISCPECQVKYCSLKCLELDNPAHKRICRTFQIMIERLHPRPDPVGTKSYKLAVLTSPDQGGMTFLWIKCDRYNEGKNVRGQKAKDECLNLGNMLRLRHLADNEECLVETEDISFSAPDGPKKYCSDHITQIFYQKDHLRNGARPNKFVQDLEVPASSGGKRDWRGPILITGAIVINKKRNYYSWEDITPKCITAAIKFFKKNGPFVLE